ncbi:stress-responsive transcription factor hsf1, partial [Modicella reniformis]
MVNTPISNDFIKWSDDGQSFIVMNQVEFAKEVLPKFFKHSNFSTFVRQLNMYGFHKVPHLQQGALITDPDSEQQEFSNEHFQRNQPDLLFLVSRKKASNSNGDKDALTTDLNHILQEVTAIKRHQVVISTDLGSIERDHQALWQELIAAREKHQGQQDTIDKILRFLASVFSADKKRAIVPNKKARLTITDGDIDGTSSVDDGLRLVEKDEEEEEEEGDGDDDNDEDGTVEILPTGKRRRPTTNVSKSSLNASEINPAILAMLANAKQPETSKQNTLSPMTTTTTAISNNQPVVSTVSSATSNINFSDHLTTLSSANYPNI